MGNEWAFNREAFKYPLCLFLHGEVISTWFLYFVHAASR